MQIGYASVIFYSWSSFILRHPSFSSNSRIGDSESEKKTKKLFTRTFEHSQHELSIVGNELKN